MKAAGFVPTPFQQKAIDEEHARHKKRIENILTKKSKEHGSSSNLKMSQQLQKNMKAMHNAKFQSIDKDNKFLLEKLIEISRKKPAAVAGASAGVSVEKKEHSHSKSLHGTYRKKEMMRISMENEAFAKRLLAQQSTFDTKKVNNDYKKHQALLVQIKRVSTSPQKAAQTKKLPPLTIDVKSPKKENISLIKSPVGKDTNKDQVNSAPPREEKISARLPESAKEVDNKKTEEVIHEKTEEVVPEVKSQKIVDEIKAEKIEEPKEEIKEAEKIPAVEEVVEEKKQASQPDVEAQPQEDKHFEVQPKSNSQIEEDIPKEEVKPEEAEKHEAATVKPEENKN